MPYSHTIILELHAIDTCDYTDRKLYFKSHRIFFSDVFISNKCGTKQIIEHLNSSGHDIKAIFICGGLSKNSLFVQCHADITGKGNIGYG